MNDLNALKRTLANLELATVEILAVTKIIKEISFRIRDILDTTYNEGNRDPYRLQITKVPDDKK